MIWEQFQFLQYAYVCCQTTLLYCKGAITTRNNNCYIGMIYKPIAVQTIYWWFATGLSVGVSWHRNKMERNVRNMANMS